MVAHEYLARSPRDCDGSLTTGSYNSPLLPKSGHVVQLVSTGSASQAFHAALFGDVYAPMASRLTTSRMHCGAHDAAESFAEAGNVHAGQYLPNWPDVPGRLALHTRGTANARRHSLSARPDLRCRAVLPAWMAMHAGRPAHSGATALDAALVSLFRGDVRAGCTARWFGEPDENDQHDARQRRDPEIVDRRQ